MCIFEVLEDGHFREKGHFRTVRYGVYMGAGLTDSVIRFWFLDEWGDAREGTARRGDT